MDIKRVRISLWFSDSMADVGIRQYESNGKVPCEKALEMITDALEINEYTTLPCMMLTFW